MVQAMYKGSKYAVINGHKFLTYMYTLKIYWPMCASNEEVRKRAKTETVSKLVRKRRWTRARGAQGQQLPPVSSPDMGTGREMQESNT